MKRSSSVTLTLVVTLAGARGQQVADPCAAASFNGKVCQAAIRGGGYCSAGAPTRVSYPQAYPYYYDQYASHLANGGSSAPSTAVGCPRSVTRGFGSTARAHAVTAGS